MCIRLLTLPLYRVRWPSLIGITKGWPCNADWHCILKITDPSITSEEDPHGTVWQDVLVFAPQHNALPNPRNQYDIVRLHRIYVRLHSLSPVRFLLASPMQTCVDNHSPGTAERSAVDVQVQEFNSRPQFVCRAGKTASFCLFDGQPQARGSLRLDVLSGGQPRHS